MAANSHPDSRAAPPRRARWIGRVAWLACVAAVVSVIAGFFYFGALVRDVADNPVQARNADGIVVLTGGSDRIVDAIGLLRQKRGKRLLISGVHPRTTANQLAQRTGTARSLFRCCIDLDYAAQNTHGNAVEGARWASKNGFESLILVTSAYHMPRAMMEFGRLLPDTALHAAPVAPDAYNSDSWWQSPATMRTLIGEYGKYLLAASRMRFGEATLPVAEPVQAKAQ